MGRFVDFGYDLFGYDLLGYWQDLFWLCDWSKDRTVVTVVAVLNNVVFAIVESVRPNSVLFEGGNPLGSVVCIPESKVNLLSGDDD